MYYLFIVTSD